MRSWRHPLAFTLVLTITTLPNTTAKRNRRGRNFTLKSRGVDALNQNDGKSNTNQFDSSLQDSQDSSSTPASPPKKNLATLLNEEIQSFHDDIATIQELPPMPLTTPCSLISRDRTYTKTWTLADWKAHKARSLKRYSQHVAKWPRSSTAENILPMIPVVMAWGLVVSLAANFVPRVEMSITKFTVTMTFLQSPVLLLLTLKTNRALDRLLEARRAWGALNRSTRSLMGLVCNYIMPQEPHGAILMARYLSIFCWSLKALLRNESDDELIECMFSSSDELRREFDWLLSCEGKRPVAILTRLRHLIAVLSHQQTEHHLQRQGSDESLDGIENISTPATLGSASVPPIALLRMEETLHAMEQSVGICNRIQTSPIPPTYTR